MSAIHSLIKFGSVHQQLVGNVKATQTVHTNVPSEYSLGTQSGQNVDRSKRDKSKRRQTKTATGPK